MNELELAKKLTAKLGKPVSAISHGGGKFSAWVSTSLPRAARERLTPTLAAISGGKAVDLNVAIKNP